MIVTNKIKFDDCWLSTEKDGQRFLLFDPECQDGVTGFYSADRAEGGTCIIAVNINRTTSPAGKIIEDTKYQLAIRFATSKSARAWAEAINHVADYMDEHHTGVDNIGSRRTS